MSLISHIGVFKSFRWRAKEDDRFIGHLEDGTTIIGAAAEGEMVPGLSYCYYGVWNDHPQHGRQFLFKQFSVQQPHSRHGVVAYLSKYASGIGPSIAAKLWDAFEGDAVKVLRTDPERVVAQPSIGRFLTLERAQQASRDLHGIQELEDTKIQLVNLFDGRGFPSVLVEDCIDKWGILAPARILRDPFCLLVEGFSGCGFSRCDRLYGDLGLPKGRLKRQMICMWNLIREETSGHTWYLCEAIETRLGEAVGNATIKFEKALQLGIRSRWLAEHVDGEGVRWVAEGERARNEQFLAARLLDLARWEFQQEFAGAINTTHWE